MLKDLVVGFLVLWTERTKYVNHTAWVDDVDGTVDRRRAKL